MRLTPLTPFVPLVLAFPLLSGAPASAADPVVVANRAPVGSLATGAPVDDLDVDAAGRLYVLDGDRVKVYASSARGSATPLRTVDLSRDLPVGQTGLLLAAADDGVVTVLGGESFDAIYDGVQDETVVVVRTDGATTSFTTEQLGLEQPNAMAAVGDEVAVVDNNTNGIDVFDLRGGLTTPVRSLPGGGRTGLVQPTVVDADELGRLVVGGYQVDGDGPRPWVAVFAPGADGDVAPRRYLTGPRTRLIDYPTGVATDRAGNVWVGSYGEGGTNVARFAPGTTGDVAPAAVLAGPRTGLGAFAATVDVLPDGRLATVAYEPSSETAPPAPASRVLVHRPLGPYAVPARPGRVTVGGQRSAATRTIRWTAAGTNPDTPVRGQRVVVRCGGVERLRKDVGPGARSLTWRAGSVRRATCSAAVVARNVYGQGAARSVTFRVER
ncbi:hypothetical protein GCM10023340_28280 [Nocardioides marinquilinus]|uniref:SMP-30/Gluconolactonase/LRE-like region domain-containing protein n=1 Tax=Nocardioides marinquilinus TaxID=1210400 RepID=A0ABP9PVW6_9ACTN